MNVPCTLCLLDDVLSDHFGSRQQCLYGCVCFSLLMFAMYDSDCSNMSNVDWLLQVVLGGGCSNVVGPNQVHKMCTREVDLLKCIQGDAHSKTISMCIFDLVNTKNPSGGIIGPGNCEWFQNLMLKVVGLVGDHYKKLMKNHACIHDACGFMMTFMLSDPDMCLACIQMHYGCLVLDQGGVFYIKLDGAMFWAIWHILLDAMTSCSIL